MLCVSFFFYFKAKYVILQNFKLATPRRFIYFLLQTILTLYERGPQLEERSECFAVDLFDCSFKTQTRIEYNTVTLMAFARNIRERRMFGTSKK